jgi:phosphatidylglycerophosphatase B
MRLVIKKTIAVLAIFLIVPLTIIVINWHWQPNSLNITSEYFFWVTETASIYWALITSAFLLILFCLLLPNKSIKNIISLSLILVTALFIGQVIKSMIKNQTTKARPYVLWMAKEYNINDKFFYSLPRPERKVLIEKTLNDSPIIPSWLAKHWQNETGYSFPSGHTLFAATFAFLAITLFGFKRHYIVVSIIILWTGLIEISRLLLGMHRPEDLVLGIIIAWSISLICCFYARKYHIVEK